LKFFSAGPQTTLPALLGVFHSPEGPAAARGFDDGALADDGAAAFGCGSEARDATTFPEEIVRDLIASGPCFPASPATDAALFGA
jgi:hypothetical protein